METAIADSYEAKFSEVICKELDERFGAMIIEKTVKEIEPNNGIDKDHWFYQKYPKWCSLNRPKQFQEIKEHNKVCNKAKLCDIEGNCGGFKCEEHDSVYLIDFVILDKIFNSF